MRIRQCADDSLDLPQSTRPRLNEVTVVCHAKMETYVTTLTQIPSHHNYAPITLDRIPAAQDLSPYNNTSLVQTAVTSATTFATTASSPSAALLAWTTTSEEALSTPAATATTLSSAETILKVKSAAMNPHHLPTPTFKNEVKKFQSLAVRSSYRRLPGNMGRWEVGST